MSFWKLQNFDSSILQPHSPPPLPNLWSSRNMASTIRQHGILLSSALRTNGYQLSRQHHTQSRSALISLENALLGRIQHTHDPSSNTSIYPKHHRRHASTAAAHASTTTSTRTHNQPRNRALPRSTTTVTTEVITTASASAAASANPPPTTRPPPLNLPARANPNTPPPPLLSPANFSHLFATGVAYLKFYKTGVKHIVTNTRLLYSSQPTQKNPSAAAPTTTTTITTTTTTTTTGASKQTEAETQTVIPKPPPSSRAHLLLRMRWLHDVRRLPLFALLLLVCGEFTPLVVLALPGAVPLTCRIPRQVKGLLEGVEGKRAVVRGGVSGRGEGGGGKGGSGSGKGKGSGVGVADMAVLLGLRVRSWTPGFVLQPRVRRQLAFLKEDDALLVAAGGARVLVEEELRLACTDRGVDVLERGERELREVLGKWLRLTDARKLGEEGREEAVKRLLLVKDSEWQG